MKCEDCQIEGDKYVLFKCDSCGAFQCKDCGNYTASEEKCFPLTKRKVLLLCNNCQVDTTTVVEMIQKNKNLKREVETYKDNLSQQRNFQQELIRTQENYETIKKSNEEKQKHIIALEKKIEQYKIKLNQCAKSEDHQKEMKDLNAKKEIVENQMKSLEVENKRLQENENFLQKDYKQLKEKMSKLESINEVLQKQIQSSNSETQMEEIVSITQENIGEIEQVNPYDSIKTEMLSLFSNLEVKLDEKFQRFANYFDSKLLTVTKELNPCKKPASYSEKAQKNPQMNQAKKWEKKEEKSSENNYNEGMNEVIDNINRDTTYPTNNNISTLNNYQRDNSTSKRTERQNSEHIRETTNLNTKNSVQATKPKTRSIFGTGQGANITIRGVKQVGHLHVCKLDPNLTEEEILNHLKSNGFSDSECKKLESNRPQEYASFKITVPKNEIENLKNPDIWPIGTRINPFLYHLNKKQSKPT